MNDVQRIHELVETLRKYNEAYRAGSPLVNDHEYDTLVEALRQEDPGNDFLQRVEPEVFKTKTEVRHPVPMLSIEKAYTIEALERFVTRVQKEADQIGITDLQFIVTPKLDGLAGRDDGTVFASRGNGEVGYEISSALDKGVVPLGGRGKGIGEITVVKSYFDEHLSGHFEHPRNMVVGIVSSDVLNDFARQALADGVVHFVPYNELPAWRGTAQALLAGIEDISADLAGRTDYPMDGMVASVVDESVRAHMGATVHHYRWQIAIKTKGETAVTVVEDVTWQVGRTGSVTPVMQVVPVSLSGATIRRVTAHHAGMIRNLNIGAGAEIEIIRSGEVIPKLEKVITPATAVQIPDSCPSCDQSLVWENDFLKCRNPECPSKMEQRISHWFKTLSNADWFGIKTIQKLAAGGYDTLEKIYAMSEEELVGLGFGPVQSHNLFEAIGISRTKPVEDWRFLAAFGITDLGKGESRRLLGHVRLENVLALRKEDLIKLHGFGPKTSKSIVKSLAEQQSTITHMLDLGFNLERTALASELQEARSPIAGKGIVFTGKMVHGSREDMQAQARTLGARVQTAVSGKTDYLVCGENVGAKKIEKARKAGTKILSEGEYMAMIGDNGMNIERPTSNDELINPII